MGNWYDTKSDGDDSDDDFDAAGFYNPLIAAIRNPTISAVEAHTSGDTLTVAESGTVHTNLGAGGTVTLNLPQSASVGVYFDFVVMIAYELRIDPGAGGGIYINGAKQSDSKYISADDEAESVRLVADGNGDWVALWTQGTWTVEG